MGTRNRNSHADPVLAEAIGRRIRAARVAAGLSQVEVAGDWCTKASISAMETGRASPSLPTLVHLASRLGVAIESLVSDAPVVMRAAPSRIRAVEVDRGRVLAELSDGRVIGVPLSSEPGLMDTTYRQLAGWRIQRGGRAIEWPDLAVVITLEAMLDGRSMPTTDDLEARGRPALSVRPAPLD